MSQSGEVVSSTATIVVAVVGSGGLTAFLTRRKTNAESETTLSGGALAWARQLSERLDATEKSTAEVVVAFERTRDDLSQAKSSLAEANSLLTKAQTRISVLEALLRANGVVVPS